MPGGVNSPVRAFNLVEDNPIVMKSGYGSVITDKDGNGYYTQGDWHPNLDPVRDTNGDGYDDYPDFEVVNDKIEFRLDYDPSSDLNLTLQTGYAYTKTQQVTGVGSYLADG